MKRESWPFLLGAAWIGALAAGFGAVWNYETTPGSFGAAPASWPKESAVPRALDRATLVMIAHPRCPCSRASVDELSRLMTRLHGRLRAQVLFYQPAGQPDAWSRTALWNAASAIPGVSARRDLGGVEARRFGAETSGQVLLYDFDGRLLFSGGITALRGHAGDNAGSRAIVALLTRGTAVGQGTPVFGCSLKGPDLWKLTKRS